MVRISILKTSAQVVAKVLRLHDEKTVKEPAITTYSRELTAEEKEEILNLIAPLSALPPKLRTDSPDDPSIDVFEIDTDGAYKALERMQNEESSLAAFSGRVTTLIPDLQLERNRIWRSSSHNTK